jgi:hypothetical protein
MKRIRSGLAMAAIASAAMACAPPSGMNEPVDQARIGSPYPVYQAAAPLTEPGRFIAADGRRWVAYDAPSPVYGADHGVEIDARLLQPLGTVDGVQLHVRANERAPYTRLYAPLGPGRWREYRPVTF